MASSIHVYLKEKEKHLLIKFGHILAVIEFKTEYSVKVSQAVRSVYPQHKQDWERKSGRIKSVQYLPNLVFSLQNIYGGTVEFYDMSTSKIDLT